MTCALASRMIAADDDFDGAPLLRREFAPRRRGTAPSLGATLTLTALGVVEASLNGRPGLRRRADARAGAATSGGCATASYDVTDLLEARRPCSASRSATAGTAAGSAGAGSRALYGDGARRVRAARDHVRRRHRAASSSPTTTGPRARAPCSPTTSTTARPSTPAAATTPGCGPGFAGRGWAGVHALDVRHRRARPVRRPAGLAPRGAAGAARSGPRRRHDARRLRPEPRRLAARSRPGRGRHRRSRSGTPRCSSTASSAPARCARAKATDRFILSGGEDVFEPTFTFHGFRYAEIDGLAGRARRAGRPRRPWWSHSELRPHRHVRVLRRPAEPAATSNVVWGHARQLPRRAHRLPAARRAARLDRRHRRRSPRPPPSSTTSTASCDDWLRRPRRSSSGTPTAWCPFVVPDVLKYVPRRRSFPAPDSTAIWSDAARLGAVGAVAGLRRPRRCSRRSSTRWPRTCAGCEALLSPTGLWDTGFQFGDWLDPDAPPDDPAEAKADNGRRRHRLRLPHARPSSPRPRRCSAAPRTTQAVRGARRADCGPRSTSTTWRRRPDHERLHDRLRARDRVRPARRADGERVAGDRLAELVAEARLPDLDRVRRHAVRHRRADPRPATSTTPTGCCWSASARRGSTR